MFLLVTCGMGMLTVEPVRALDAFLFNKSCVDHIVFLYMESQPPRSVLQ